MTTKYVLVLFGLVFIAICVSATMPAILDTIPQRKVMRLILFTEGDCVDSIDLHKLHDKHNKDFFQSKLPSDLITCWDKTLIPMDALGYTDQGGPEGKTRIRLSPAMQGQLINYAEMILFHEEVHVELRLSKEIWEPAHGPIFQVRMKELAKLGAFDELW